MHARVCPSLSELPPSFLISTVLVVATYLNSLPLNVGVGMYPPCWESQFGVGRGITAVSLGEASDEQLLPAGKQRTTPPLRLQLIGWVMSGQLIPLLGVHGPAAYEGGQAGPVPSP